MNPITPYFTIHVVDHATNGLPVVLMNSLGLRFEAIDGNDDDLHCSFDMGDVTVSVFFSPSTDSGHIELWNFMTNKRIDDRHALTLTYAGDIIWTNF